MNKIENLKKKLDAMCNKYSFHTGFSFIDLKTGESFDREGDTVVPCASTRKISILMCALNQVALGNISLKDDFWIDESNQTSGSGIFEYFYPGCKMTFHDALVGMISISDNSCTNGIFNVIGLDKVNEYCTKIDMSNTVYRYGKIPPHKHTPIKPFSIDTTNITTPNDEAKLLKLIFQGTSNIATAEFLGVTTELCNLAIDILFMQKLNSRLPFMLPSEARVAHKTGTQRKIIFNDAGIIYQDKKALCVITVYTYKVPEMTRDLPGKYVASSLISKIARACWDYYQ